MVLVREVAAVEDQPQQEEKAVLPTKIQKKKKTVKASKVV